MGNLETAALKPTRLRVISAVHEWVRDLRRPPHLVAPLLLVIIVIWSAIWLGFFKGQNPFEVMTGLRLTQVIQTAAPLATLALGGGLVIASGEIDLSNVAIAACCGVVFAAAVNSGWGFMPSTMAALTVGGCVGSFNGLLVARVNAPSLIVTWVTGTFLTVAALLLAAKSSLAPDGSERVSGINLEGFRPNTFADALSTGSVSFALVLLLLSSFCASSNLSREAMAVGTDSQAASYIGIRPKAVTFKVFVISGLFSAVAGIMHVFSLEAARTTERQATGLVVVAICVLGGTLLSGGYFSAFSIICAAILWSILELIVPGFEIPLFGQQESRLLTVVFGMIVLIAVVAFARFLSGHLRPVLMRFETDD